MNGKVKTLNRHQINVIDRSNKQMHDELNAIARDKQADYMETTDEWAERVFEKEDGEL